MAPAPWAAASSLLYGFLDAATDLWHQYRIPFLLSVFSVLLVLRIYLHVADTSSARDGLLVLPKIYNANGSKNGQSEKAFSKTVVSSKGAVRSQDSLAAATTGGRGAAPVGASAAAAATTVTSKPEAAAAAAAALSKSKAASGPRRIKGGGLNGRLRSVADEVVANPPSKIQTLVFFTSLTGSTTKIVGEYVSRLGSALTALDTESQRQKPIFYPPKALDLAEVDLDDYFIAPPSSSSSRSRSLGGAADDDAAADDTTDYFYLFFIPSYNIDSINDTFLEHLQETHHDFRIDSAPLAPVLGYSVFGLGDREGWPTEADGFCFQAREIDRWMAKLTGRKRAFPLGCGDVKASGAGAGVGENPLALRLLEWTDGVVDVLGLLARTGSLGEGVPGSGEPVESEDEDEDEDGGEAEAEAEPEADDASGDGENGEKEGGKAVGGSLAVKGLKKTGTIDDVEDLGRILQDSEPSAPATKRNSATAPIAVDFTSFGVKGQRGVTKRPAHDPDISRARPMAAPAPKEMVAKNTPTYKSLTKQGYAIVGSHSGVKICRWTKSALRGRGSCYKYSFYGINSHQCMETTPSLSCSNKCVFCWRHGTNPVGTTWRWVVDPPELIFAGVKANHYAKIKNLRGVPGVRAERYAEALRIRHCALSLVGEPIFYPHINEFVAMLHGENISSFLVCNAQHPDQLANLAHVTQLYVSIDATNREALRRIDRPLHRDFWERFQRCLAILREQRFHQRTVFRLTLVKGFNVAEGGAAEGGGGDGDDDDEANGMALVRGYADLIEQALPCFVEIKGVTYCGTSTTAGVGLSMANVPFYHEVCAFVVALDRELRARGLDYGIGAEHAHSCCVLLASGRFRDDQGRFHTLIDYDRFFQLLRERGPRGDFGPEDYMGPPTPEWAAWGRGGFDPRDQRVDRKGRPIEAK